MSSDASARARPRLLIVGAYAVAAAVAFGLVVADIAYAAVIRSSAVEPEVAAAIFARSADALLLADVSTLLLGIVAIAAAWPWPGARVRLVAAVAVCLLGPIVAVVASAFAGSHAAALDACGPWLRLVTFGTPPVLAFAAFAQLLAR